MSDRARIARAIQQVRAVRRTWPDGVPADVAEWLDGFDVAVADFIDEAKGVLHLTDEDINRY